MRPCMREQMHKSFSATTQNFNLAIIIAMVLEWKTRTAYALTELVAFAIGAAIVVYVVINIAVLVFYKYYKSKKNLVLWQRELFEAVFTTAIAFSPIPCSKSEQSEATAANGSQGGSPIPRSQSKTTAANGSQGGSPIPRSQSEGNAADGGQGEAIIVNTPSSLPDSGSVADRDITNAETDGNHRCTPNADNEIGIVFLGFQEQGYTFSGRKKKLVNVWVHVYFTLLCGLVALWFLAIFSDSVFYRKTNSCLDLSVSDTDTTCFLLSTKDVPPGVQQILDEEKGELVPCQKVQTYLSRSNSTYDLEVICYQSQLSPLAALGVAYGATKSIVFVIIAVLSGILKLSAKLDQKEWPKTLVCINQIILSIVVVIIIVVVPPSLHNSGRSRNTSFDFLRGERFYSISVVALLAISTVILLGLFPWWAFKRLKLGKGFNTEDVDFHKLPMQEDIQKVLTYHKFFSHTGIFD